MRGPRFASDDVLLRVSEDLFRAVAVVRGDGGDDAVQAAGGPVFDIGHGDAVGDDAGHGERVKVDALVLGGDGFEDGLPIGGGDRVVWLSLDEEGKGAEAKAGGGYALLDVFGAGVVGAGLVEDVDERSAAGEVVEGAVVGDGGDVALVAGDAAESPEDVGDVLGEGLVRAGCGGEAVDGAGAVLLPAPGSSRLRMTGLAA